MKYVPGFESRYSVTTDGRVYSHLREKFLKPRVTSTGYHRVTLYRGRKRNLFRVHRLVAMTYISKPAGKTQINHIDCNKLNNHVSNLEWCTGLENMQHAQRMGRTPMRKVKSVQRKTIKLLLAKGASYAEIMFAMEVTENAIIASKY